MTLDLTALESTVAQLKEALVLYNREPYKSDPLLRRHLRAATIKAFEYTYAISLKMIKRHMKNTAPEPDEIDDMTFNDFVRMAFGKGILRSDVAVWRDYRRQRGTTGHTYDEQKAQDIFGILPDFLIESQYVLARLQEKNRFGQQHD